MSSLTMSFCSNKILSFSSRVRRRPLFYDIDIDSLNGFFSSYCGCLNQSSSNGKFRFVFLPAFSMMISVARIGSGSSSELAQFSWWMRRISLIALITWFDSSMAVCFSRSSYSKGSCSVMCNSQIASSSSGTESRFLRPKKLYFRILWDCLTKFYPKQIKFHFGSTAFSSSN